MIPIENEEKLAYFGHCSEIAMENLPQYSSLNQVGAISSCTCTRAVRTTHCLLIDFPIKVST